MDLWISCNACHATFRAETHSGLVRCEACSERMAYRMPRAQPVQVMA